MTSVDWIDITCTPPPDSSVLIRAHNGDMAVASVRYWRANCPSWDPMGISGPEWDWDWEEPVGRKFPFGGVTHWAPLPEQPKENSDV